MNDVSVASTWLQVRGFVPSEIDQLRLKLPFAGGASIARASGGPESSPQAASSVRRRKAPSRFLRGFEWLTLPMIAPFIMVAAIIRSIDALKSFDIIYAMTQGGPGTASETINIYLYNTSFAYYNLGYGSAIAILIVVLGVVISQIANRIFKEKDY